MVFDRYVLHLFSGSGGGVLGSILLGEEIVGAVEFEKYPRETLLARQRDGILPTFPIWDDVCTFRVDNEETREYIEFLISIRERLTIAGGFPCQDISIAGKGVGIDGDRSGLWSEMCRIISEIRPRHILLENSPMLIVRGFDRVISDLAKIRYSLAWSILGASDVGANHQRDRFWGFGTAEEYLDRERDSYSNTDSDGCDRFIRGGRSCETEDNFRGVSLARLVEQEPHKMWPEKMNGGGITYPTPVASEVRQGFQNRNNGKKGTQKSLTTVVIERNSRLRPQETTKAAIQKNILSEETISDNSPTMSNMELRGGIRFPTPRARDWKGGIANPEHLQSADGRFNRMGNLDTFVRFYSKVEKKMEDSGVFGCKYEWNSEGIPVTPGGTGERDEDR